MALSKVLEKLGRAVFESPFGAHELVREAPELAEIRLTALEAIKARSHRVGGSNVFAPDLVRIVLRGIPREQAALFESEFLTGYFAQELREGLSRSSYRFPATLSVEFVTMPLLPVAGESWIAVETPAPMKAGRLEVLAGAANQAVMLLQKQRVNIGRTAEVFRQSGPSRRNDLAFLGEGEIEASVSREHAHIVRDAKNHQYRIFNDRVYRGDENCGIWIVRDGLSFAVHRGARGTLLEHGDEVHIGRALLRFERTGD